MMSAVASANQFQRARPHPQIVTGGLAAPPGSRPVDLDEVALSIGYTTHVRRFASHRAS